MNRSVWFVVALSIAIPASCAAQNTISPPKPFGPVPTANQLEWHEMEYFGLVCYGLNTYTGQEWGYGDVSTDVFQPTDLNTDQWARVAKASGMTGLILVAKHHDGFCLWPSRTTDYTIAATSWKNGKGDILGDLSQSCKKYGLKLGVYVSPWDRNHAEYGNEKYIKDYFEQWREVLTNYGPIFEVWFDGANGGTGYYGGAREQRSIPKDYYQYPKVFKMIKELQPKAIFFGGVNTDAARWVGNESGYANKTNWCTFSDTQTSDLKLRESGLKGGQYWLPAEADTTILYPKKWYFNKGSKPRTLKQFTDLYYTTIGRNAAFNLGLSIAPSGRIHNDDVKAMLAQKKQIDKELARDLARSTAITATQSRDNRSFSPQNTVDGTTKSYWATSDGTKSASLTIDFKKPTTFNRLLLQEYIPLGQRVDNFTLEVFQNSSWITASKGTTIGYKRILRFDPVRTSKAKLTLSTDAPCLTLSNLSVYNAPIIMTDPVINADRAGMISIEAPAGASVFYAIASKTSTTDFKKYTTPFDLSSGGIVKAYALDPSDNSRTDAVTSIFGIAKANWKIVGCTFSNKDNGSVNHLIDGDPNTMWHTHGVTEGRQSPPQSVTVDLGRTVNIAAFTYMPRHDACFVGLVDRYEFYVSDNGTDWNAPAAKGEFHNIKNNPIQQIVNLPKPHKAQFVKFTATHTLEANDCVAVCELGIIAAED